MTNLEHIDAEKNLRLFAHTLIKMRELGISSTRIISGSDKNSGVKSYSNDSMEGVDEMIDRINKSPHIFGEFYDHLNTSCDEYREFLIKFIIHVKYNILISPDVSLEELKEKKKKYDAVLNYIKEYK